MNDGLSPLMRHLINEHLTDKQRDVVRLRNQGHGWKRIGTILDVDPSTARTHWAAASKKLRRELLRIQHEGETA